MSGPLDLAPHLRQPGKVHVRIDPSTTEVGVTVHIRRRFGAKRNDASAEAIH